MDLIEMILDEEKRDPGIWNTLPSLGWDALLKVEEVWRKRLEVTNARKTWFDVYQKLRRAQQHTIEYRTFRRGFIDVYGCCKHCHGTTSLQIHHKKSWYSCVEGRMDPTNCEVICGRCHREEDSSVFYNKQGRTAAVRAEQELLSALRAAKRQVPEQEEPADKVNPEHV